MKDRVSTILLMSRWDAKHAGQGWVSDLERTVVRRLRSTSRQGSLTRGMSGWILPAAGCCLRWALLLGEAFQFVLLIPHVEALEGDPLCSATRDAAAVPRYKEGHDSAEIFSMHHSLINLWTRAPNRDPPLISRLSVGAMRKM